MDSLEQIRSKVKEKVQQAHSTIIIAAYKKMIDNHNEFCGCNYCLLLGQYVDLKRSHSYMRKLINSADYDYFDSRVSMSDLLYIDKIKLDTRQLKIQKDSLKQL